MAHRLGAGMDHRIGDGSALSVRGMPRVGPSPSNVFDVLLHETPRITNKSGRDDRHRDDPAR